MSSLDLLRRLAGNNAWSNLRLYRACAKLSREEFEAPRTSFFPSIPQTLNHILTVDWFYIDALEEGGKGASVLANEVPFPDFEPLWTAQRESDVRLVTFVDRLTDADLARKVRLERQHHVQVERVDDVIVHLTTHQIHHRGQVHAMLSGTQVAPPQLDEFFMSEELPLRENELRDLGLPIR